MKRTRRGLPRHRAQPAAADHRAAASTSAEDARRYFEAALPSSKLRGFDIAFLAYRHAQGAVEGEDHELTAHVATIRDGLAAIDAALRQMGPAAIAMGLRSSVLGIWAMAVLCRRVFEQSPWAHLRARRRRRGEKTGNDTLLSDVALVAMWLDLIRNHEWPMDEVNSPLGPGNRVSDKTHDDADFALAAIAVGMDAPCVGEDDDFPTRVEKWRKRRARQGR